MITNDAVIMGLLAAILGGVFITESSKNPFWRKFYSFVPGLLLCYFLPSLLNTTGIIDGSDSKLYFVASRYLLPGALVLLIVSADLKKIFGLGSKAVIMFLTGTLGIIIGGPAAIVILDFINPDLVSGDVWRGLTTVAGSWIGGGANQAAMKEVFGVGDQLFSAMITVDVICANIWMAILLIMAGRQKKMDAWLKADTSSIDELKETVAKYEEENSRPITTTDMMKVVAIAFGLTGLAHFGSDLIAPWIATNAPGLEKYSLTSGFFWLIVLVTTFALIASMFKPARTLEHAGASKIGSAFIYILVATIGMQMDVTAILDNPGYFFIGITWLTIHALLMIFVAKLIRAPLFFMAVGSQANVGGAASAPVVAAAFHPSLAPVGILMAVLGYALGTYGAYICGIIMQAAVGVVG
ncbi:hypothetical protein VME0621_03609 [Vibrio mediterranei]|uniref:DUF819 domain-containing protein n=1 Tax=Vibrio mediterranei TaxID=689 RepID=A0ABX5D659_9VIBR|nr:MULTISPECIES: DUF819 family protein [Vibrio]KFA97109.1 membrane protein [Vibrio sp. ER1A]MCF4176513.1 DUF819 family protein [Vibrio sp. McD22-P3]MCG9627175.1 DUF819 family protein [Vibrio mediterranei]MCG9659563.1 DUF819 family protein [Vibrio mediterranei]MCG9664835.1 DUF819 family protein [Vibrio mediterranei]